MGKQEKTQKSIKRLVDFIKLIQLRKNTLSPPPQSTSSAISCPPQTSSSHSPPFPSTSQKTTTTPPSSIPNNNKTSHLATLTVSTSTHDRTSPTSESKITCPAPTNCPVALPSNQKSNHSSSVTSSRKSPNRLEGTLGSLLTVKPNIKTVPKFPAPVLLNDSIGPSSTIPPSPCSTIVTSVRSKSNAPSHSTASPYQNCQILFSPSRTTISWTERPSTAESPGSIHATSSPTSQQPDPQQKSYCLPIATLKAAVTSSCSTGQSQLDHRRIQEQQRVSFVMVSSRQDPAPLPSSTHCSQAITSPIPSAIVHASHEASAQTIETIRSCDSISVAESTNWCRASSQTATSQQQSSSSDVASPSSSST